MGSGVKNVLGHSERLGYLKGLVVLAIVDNYYYETKQK